MGLDIKRNKDGLYKLRSSVSDELLHNDGWITENEVKKILIERAFWTFVRTTIEIDMEFPNGYHVNNKMQRIKDKDQAGGKFVIDNWGTKIIDDKFKEICEKLEIKIEI